MLGWGYEGVHIEGHRVIIDRSCQVDDRLPLHSERQGQIVITLPSMVCNMRWQLALYLLLRCSTALRGQEPSTVTTKAFQDGRPHKPAIIVVFHSVITAIALQMPADASLEQRLLSSCSKVQHMILP